MVFVVPGCGLFTRLQAAEWLGIHPITLDRLRAKDPQLAACVRPVGYRVMYSPAKLAQWVEDQADKPPVHRPRRPRRSRWSTSRGRRKAG